ncbi:MAG: tryptophan synthase subunit alpha [Clostridiales bacterium]|nr:tryptophan synthase subunit alpha [Clostridiales bacterium]
MIKIAEAFSHGKAFIAFITAGDPSLELTEQLIPAMAQAGADLIEIGLPFSDPVAEGIVIQDANERALKSGCTTDRVFEMLERVSPRVNVPLVFLTYLNPIMSYGKEKFMSRCKKCGISGLIVPDMPFEEKEELKSVCKKYGVEIISMVAPTSQKRIAVIAKESEGFVYCVSSMGVTGVRSEITEDIGAMVNTVKSVTDVPVAVGFGISAPEQAKNMADLADGVIVGSAIVRIVEQHGKACVKPVCEYIRQMKEAVTRS